MTNRPRDPFISLEIQASSSDPLLRSPKISPPILRRGGKLWNETSSSPTKVSTTAAAATVSVTLLSSEPWSPLSASLSSDVVETHAKVLEEVREHAHSVACLEERRLHHDNAEPVIEPSLDLIRSTFLIFYYVWTPSFSPEDVCSHIVSSWKRLQGASPQVVGPRLSSVCALGSDSVAIVDDTFLNDGAALEYGDKFNSSAPVPSFPSSLIDESDESKHSDENGVGALDNGSGDGEKYNAKQQVYLVIDQLFGHGNSLNEEEMDFQAKSLAKTLAITPEIRSRCEGVSICVSHVPSPPTYSAAAELLALSSTMDTVVPAPPGLELVRQALRVGDNQRVLQDQREFNSSNCTAMASKSFIGVVTTAPSVFDGLTSLCGGSLADEPDSAAFIDDDAESTPPRSRDEARRTADLYSDVHPPMTVVAEWNGMGNLFAFAQRAHAEWRQSVGWPPEPRPRPPPRKIPRRIRRSRPPVASPQPSLIQVLPSTKDNTMNAYVETSKLRHQEEFRQDIVAAFLIACYLWFHFAADCRLVVWLILAPSGHAEMVQYLREWR